MLDRSARLLKDFNAFLNCEAKFHHVNENMKSKNFKFQHCFNSTGCVCVFSGGGGGGALFLKA